MACGREAPDEPRGGPDRLELVAQIVSSFVANNTVGANELPQVIARVADALAAAESGRPADPPEAPKPAVPVRRSVHADHIICLEDGKKFKSLKRHLRTQYNLTPEEYRERWGLPHDYPMVAPNYAKARSQLAKKMGLGTRRDASD